MALNIKNSTAHTMALQLAQKTGESVTDAVTEAIRERLARTDTDQAETKARLRAIVSECVPLWTLPVMDHADLYDEMGLPR